MKVKQSSNLVKIFIGTSSLGLVALGGVLMAGAVIDEASADTATSNLSITVPVSIAPPAVASTVSFDMTPDADGEFATSSLVPVTVSTNNPTGYTLTMSASTTTTALTNSATSPAATIPTLSSTVAAATYSTSATYNNTWGFTHNNTGTADAETGVITADTYLPVASSASPTTIRVTDSNSGVATTNLTFAARVDLDKPSGTYNNTVTFSAVANALPTPLVNGMNMQDATASMCADSETWTADNPVEYELVDTRGMVSGLSYDSYTIRKLADGNCWMVDNLRLPGGTTITSSDSDVTSNYTLPSSSTSGFNSDTGQFMYDNPNNTNGYDSSYYSWLVAVAKTSSPSSTQYYNVPTSICPKGWHLPSAYGASSQAGQSSSSVKGQFRNLYTAYSSTVSTFDTAFNSVFAGLYDDSSFYNGGSDGRWWSSTVGSSAYAYYLSAYSSNVAPTNSYYRRDGYSIRCVLAS